MNANNETIFFVYNADNDFLSIIDDFFHKNISPKTYTCQLCFLTYGAFTKKRKWTNYLSNLNYKYEFIYKNNIDQLVYDGKEYPVILIGNYNSNKKLVSSKELIQCGTLEELIAKINLKLKEY